MAKIKPAINKRPGSAGAAQPTALGEARAKLDALGTEWLCQQIVEMRSMTQIATLAGVSLGSLIAWISADAERSARAREARAATAKAWDDAAVKEIAAAGSPFALSKAKELAHHYRWRASKIAPREYGDKLEVEANVTHDVIGDLREFLSNRAGKLTPKEA